MVAWERYNSDQTVGGAIYLRRLDDDSWGDVGSSTSGAGVSEGTTNAQHVSVRAHGDSVHLLWRVSDERPDASFRQDLRYRRLEGDTWHLLEDIGGSTAARPKGSIALTASGWLVIVWQQATADGYEIRAARRREEGWLPGPRQRGLPRGRSTERRRGPQRRDLRRLSGARRPRTEYPPASPRRGSLVTRG